MEALLINPATRIALEASAKQPPHALLLLGAEGIGKLTLAKAWAHHVADGSALLQVVTPDERGTITIEAIRELYKTVRGKREEPQIIIVDHAEAMSLEAENAFLKLLEEPRPGVTFVLTAPHTEALLPTILSRVQRITVLPCSTAVLHAYATQHASAPSQADLVQLLFIAKGRPATLIRLLEQTDELAEARAIMAQAKELLAAKPYERYIFVSKSSGDRKTCVAVLEAMQYMASLQLKKSASESQAQRWLVLSQALETTLQQLVANGNVKAQLLKLFTSY